MKICFIGGGNMATALIGGLLGKGFVAGQISVVEISADNRVRLQRNFAVHAVETLAEGVPGSEVIVLAVKPQQLREVAQGIQREGPEGAPSEALQGFLTMHKDHLLPALCKALNIDAHAHHVAALANKTKVKVAIRDLKKQRDAALTAHDGKKLREIRPLIHALKRKLRKAAV